MTREALKLALEALEHEADKGNDDAYKVERDAIKEALAQPEQEPVTWRYKIVDVFGRPAWTLKTPKSDTRVLESQPLYTTPPQQEPVRIMGFNCKCGRRMEVSAEQGVVPAPQRTWVGLTLDERIELAKDVDWPVGAYCEYAEKIEAKLKEKNELR